MILAGLFQVIHVVQKNKNQFMLMILVNGVVKIMTGVVLSQLKIKPPLLRKLQIRRLLPLKLLQLLLILTTTRIESNLHTQKKRINVVPGLLLIMFAVLPIVIMKIPPKVVVPVEV